MPIKNLFFRFFDIMELYYISLSFAVFGILVEDDIVVDSAPIGRWMVGRNIKVVMKYVEKHNGKIIKCKSGV